MRTYGFLTKEPVIELSKTVAELQQTLKNALFSETKIETDEKLREAYALLTLIESIFNQCKTIVA